MDIRHTSRGTYMNTVGWGLIACAIIVAVAAGLGRATINLQGALTGKPDIAIYMLLPDEGIRSVTILRENDTERHYLAETKSGPKLIVLKMGEKQWYVARMENLHETTEPGDHAAVPTEESAPQQ